MLVCERFTGGPGGGKGKGSWGYTAEEQDGWGTVRQAGRVGIWGETGGQPGEGPQKVVEGALREGGRREAGRDAGRPAAYLSRSPACSASSHLSLLSGVVGKSWQGSRGVDRAARGKAGKFPAIPLSPKFKFGHQGAGIAAALVSSPLFLAEV